MASTGTLYGAATLAHPSTGAAQAAPAPGLQSESWEDLAQRNQEHEHQLQAVHAQQLQAQQSAWEAYTAQQLQQLQTAQQQAQAYQQQLQRLNPHLLVAQRAKHDAGLTLIQYVAIAAFAGGLVAMVLPRGSS